MMSSTSAKLNYFGASEHSRLTQLKLFLTLTLNKERVTFVSDVVREKQKSSSFICFANLPSM